MRPRMEERGCFVGLTDRLPIFSRRNDSVVLRQRRAAATGLRGENVRSAPSFRVGHVVS